MMQNSQNYNAFERFGGTQLLNRMFIELHCNIRYLTPNENFSFPLNFRFQIKTISLQKSLIQI